MNLIDILVLLLALSGTLNIALVAGIITRLCGQSLPRCVIAAGAAATAVLAVFFAALGAYL